ncbi:MAG: Hsp20/alpha crystallin family protein [Bacteriovoracaceae bacterium]
MKANAAIALALICGLIIGGVGTHFYKEHEEQKAATTLPLKFSPEDLFGGPSLGVSLGDFGHELKQDEDSKSITYRLDLTGLNKDTIKVSVEGGQVNISGENKTVQAQEEKGGTVRSESYSSFERSFPVPEGTDPTQVSVQHETNELVIRFPKK